MIENKGEVNIFKHSKVNAVLILYPNAHNRSIKENTFNVFFIRKLKQNERQKNGYYRIHQG